MNEIKMRRCGFLADILNYMVAFLLLLMFGVVMMGVIARYVAKKPVFWTEELSRYLMVYMVLLGSSVALWKDEHPKLTFILEKFPPRVRHYWSIVIDGLIFLLLLIVFQEGYLMAIDASIARTPALRVSFFWVYLCFPLGAVFMMAQVLTKYVFRKKP